jgi:hypothetical protein
MLWMTWRASGGSAYLDVLAPLADDLPDVFGRHLHRHDAVAQLEIKGKA